MDPAKIAKLQELRRAMMEILGPNYNLSLKQKLAFSILNAGYAQDRLGYDREKAYRESFLDVWFPFYLASKYDSDLEDWANAVLLGDSEPEHPNWLGRNEDLEPKVPPEPPKIKGWQNRD